MPPSCSSCGVPVEGYSPRAANVKCEACRKTPLKHKRGDTEGTVPCRVCGLARTRLGKHLQAAHGLSPEAYRAQFPDALIEIVGTRTRSTECRAKQAAAARERWSTPEAREEQAERLRESAAWKGKHLSDEHRQAISAGGRGKAHNVSPEGRLAQGEQGHAALAALRLRPDHRAKLSAGQLRRVARGERVGFQVPGRWEKGYQSRIRNGTLIPQGGGRGICGFRKDIPHYTRSTFEANFARVLLHEGVPYEYEPTLFRLANGRHYTPDFRLLANLREWVPKGLVELKGWRKNDGSLPADADTKLAAVKEEFGEFVFPLALCDEAWRSIEKHYASLIPLWETPRRNMRSHPDLYAADGARCFFYASSMLTRPGNRPVQKLVP